MRFNQIFAIIALLFNPFLCAMQLSVKQSSARKSYTLKEFTIGERTREIFIRNHLTEEESNEKSGQFGLEEILANDPYVHNCTQQKMVLSPETFRMIQDFSFKQLAEKHPNHLIVQRKKIIEKQQERLSALKKANAIVQKESDELEKTFNKLTTLLAIAQQQAQPEKKTSKNKSMVPKNTTSTPKQNTQQLNPPQSIATSKQHWHALQSLMKLRNVTQKQFLVKNLLDLCDDIWYDRIENDKFAGPYFNKRNHMLRGPINKNWSYLFSPCTNEVNTINTPYCLLAHNSPCDAPNCSYYVAKISLKPDQTICQTSSTQSHSSSDELSEPD